MKAIIVLAFVSTLVGSFAKEFNCYQCRSYREKDCKTHLEHDNYLKPCSDNPTGCYIATYKIFGVEIVERGCISDLSKPYCGWQKVSFCHKCEQPGCNKKGPVKRNLTK